MDTQCIYYIGNATAKWNRSSVGKRGEFAFSLFYTGSSPTREQIFQLEKIAFMFLSYLCKSFRCLYDFTTFVVKIYITQK